jgi:hypothetical protein
LLKSCVLFNAWKNFQINKVWRIDDLKNSGLLRTKRTFKKVTKIERSTYQKTSVYFFQQVKNKKQEKNLLFLSVVVYVWGKVLQNNKFVTFSFSLVPILAFF